MKYAGFYINLERSPDRRKRIEEELARCGLGGLYTRFSAADGNALHFPNPNLREGEMGCFTSHYRLMMENKDRPRPVHVIEDDILLSPPVESMLDQLIENGELAKYDIVFTDLYVPVTNTDCNFYKTYYDMNVKRDNTGRFESVSFSLIDMRGREFAATCSFIVNPESIGKLAALYEDELKRGARLPIDLYMRYLCNNGDIKVGCLFPFITSIRPENCFDTDVHNRPDLITIHATNMLRHSFFIGCDLARCLEEASRVYPQPEASDLHRQLMLLLMGYSLTPQWGKS